MCTPHTHMHTRVRPSPLHIARPPPPHSHTPPPPSRCHVFCSAVDQHTAQHIFKHCIRGLLREKAVVWITHQLELLPQCDNIMIMEQGTVLYWGGYDPEALNKHLPVDHLLFATVVAGGWQWAGWGGRGSGESACWGAGRSLVWCCTGGGYDLEIINNNTII